MTILRLLWAMLSIPLTITFHTDLLTSNAIYYKKCTRKQECYEKVGKGNSVTQVGACRPSMESALISRDPISSSAVSRDEPVTCIMNAIGGSIFIAVLC